MASSPYFDKAKGRWRMKFWAGGDAGWKIVTLCPHPGGWVKGKPPRKAPPEALALARKYIDMETRARQGIAVLPSRGHDLADYLDAYREQFAAGCAPGSLPTLDRAIRLFKAHCVTARVKTLEGVTTATCRTFLAARAATVKWATMRAEKGLLSPVWTQAKHDGLVATNPWEAAPLPGKPRREAPPFWSREELARLARACERTPWLRDLVLVGANCGFRIDALLSLEWRDVSFERNVIVCRAATAKGARRYEVPMSATANEVLMRRWLARNPGQDLVFPGPRSGRKMRSGTPFDRLGKAVRRAKLPDHGRYNHILRHTFASHAVMSGVPLIVVSAWLGHSSVSMTERYAHLCPKERDRQMEKFDLGYGQSSAGGSAGEAAAGPRSGPSSGPLPS